MKLYASVTLALYVSGLVDLPTAVTEYVTKRALVLVWTHHLYAGYLISLLSEDSQLKCTRKTVPVCIKKAYWRSRVTVHNCLVVIFCP